MIEAGISTRMGAGWGLNCLGEVVQEKVQRDIVHKSGLCHGIERGQTASHTTHAMAQEHGDCLRVVLHDLSYYHMRGYF